MSLAERWRRWGRKADLLHLDMQESGPWDPQQWARRWGHPWRSPTNQKSKARVPRSPPSPPLHTHTHRQHTHNPEHSPVGLTLASLRNSWGAWEGALPSGQAKPEPGRSIWWPSHPSPGWGKEQPKGTRPGGLSLGPAGLPKLAELVTNECRRAGAAGLLYPHWRPRAGRQWAPGPVLIVRICGRGHEGAQRAPGLPIPETLDVTLWERKHRCKSATAEPCPESHPGRWPRPAPSQA